MPQGPAGFASFDKTSVGPGEGIRCLLPSLGTHTAGTGKLAFDPHCITAHVLSSHTLKTKQKLGTSTVRRLGCG